MPKDPRRNRDSYEIDAGRLNRFEFQQNQEAMAEDERTRFEKLEAERREREDATTESGPQTEAERIAQVIEDAHEKVARKEARESQPPAGRPARNAKKGASGKPKKATQKAAAKKAVPAKKGAGAAKKGTAKKKTAAKAAPGKSAKKGSAKKAGAAGKSAASKSSAKKSNSPNSGSKKSSTRSAKSGARKTALRS